MPAIEVNKVEIYLFRRRPRLQFLALRRSPDRKTLPRVWQPVTGGIEWGEKAIKAAIREVREETGLRPRRWWALETMTAYYDAARDRVVALPLFAAEVGARDRVKLSKEHTAWAFVSPADAARRFLWETQRRALEAVQREVIAGGPLAAALEIALPKPRRPAGDHRRTKKSRGG